MSKSCVAGGPIQPCVLKSEHRIRPAWDCTIDKGHLMRCRETMLKPRCRDTLSPELITRFSMIPSPLLPHPIAADTLPNTSIAPRTSTDLRSPFFQRVKLGGGQLKYDVQTTILDLEDGVGPSAKAERRLAIVEIVTHSAAASNNILIRLNSIADSDELAEDIARCCLPGVTGFILPMLRNAEDVRVYDQLITAKENELRLPQGTFEFHLLLELASAIVNIDAIVAASDRSVSLMFGREDFMADLSGYPAAAAADLANARIALTASAHGMQAVASPFCNVSNTPGFRNYCLQMRALGFSGVLTIHPAQISIAEEVFGVDPAELCKAQNMIYSGSEKESIHREGDCLVGPPMIKKAKKIIRQAALEGNSNAQEKLPGTVGNLPKYGLDLTRAQTGDILESPHVFTMDDSWRTRWMAHFPTSEWTVTSAPFAREMGMSERAFPTSLLVNLCLCLSVEPFSQSCTYHLGLRNAEQVGEILAGDTLRNIIRIESLRNTTRGDASVIVTTHLLINQNDECVFRLTKDSYFPPIPGLSERKISSAKNPLHVVFDNALAISGKLPELLHPETRSSLKKSSKSELTQGQVILHPAVRPIGWSENLELTTLVRNTHPVHFDAQRYAPEEIVVCGGFVQSMAFGLSSPEFRQIVHEELEHSAHIFTVAPGDRIGAVSKVLSIQQISEGFEEVRVKTLGLKNVDIEAELVGVEIPDILFSEEEMKPAEVKEILRRYCPVLAGKLALHATRRLIRPIGI